DTTNLPIFADSFFFFQAEDGIRDFHVTGVQTCALPISPPVPDVSRSAGLKPPVFSGHHPRPFPPTAVPPEKGSGCPAESQAGEEIGRASCRERVCVQEVVVPLTQHVSHISTSLYHRPTQ